MKFFHTLILLLFSFNFLAQQHTLSGYVKDANSGEALIGVSVFIEELGKGTTTNVYGFYSLTLQKGNYKVKYSYVGYNDLYKDVIFQDHIRINIDLSEADDLLQEVVIEAEQTDENTTGTQLSLSGSTATATDHNGTNVFGNFQVVGSSSFAHSADFNVSEKFILVNSGSTPRVDDDFGFTGQTSAAPNGKAIFWAYTGSATPAGGAFRFASGSAGGGQLDMETVFGTMRLHLGNTSGNPNGNTYSTFHKQSGYTIIDSGGTAEDSFYMYVE